MMSLIALACSFEERSKEFIIVSSSEGNQHDDHQLIHYPLPSVVEIRVHIFAPEQDVTSKQASSVDLRQTYP